MAERFPRYSHSIGNFSICLDNLLQTPQMKRRAPHTHTSKYTQEMYIYIYFVTVGEGKKDPRSAIEDDDIR